MPTRSELESRLQNPADISAELGTALGNIGALCEGRNVLLYASGFMQHPAGDSSIATEDMNGLMDAVNGLNAADGLVLVLHTPGGQIHAVENIVEYLHRKFDDITAIVPLMAMSGGSMISLACHKIIMGKQSQIGPIDPQIPASNRNNRHHSARGIVDTFNKATREILADNKRALIWNPILMAMGPSLLDEAEKALALSQELVSKWLRKRMFRNDPDARQKADGIAAFLNADSDAGDKSSKIYMHGQRVDIGTLSHHSVKVEALEDRQELQDAVLTAYHTATLIFERHNILKVIANQKGKMWLKRHIPASRPA